MSLKIAFVYQNKTIVLRQDLTAEIDDLLRDAAAELKIEEFSTVTLFYGQIAPPGGPSGRRAGYRC